MANYQNETSGMSRRNFLGLSLGAGALAAAGCSPFEKMPERLNDPYHRFVKETLDSLQGAGAGVADTAWTAHQQQLGDRYTTALRWLHNVNKAAVKVVDGQKLHREKTLHSIHGDRAKLADALKLTPEAKAKFIESYLAGLSTEQQNVLTDSLTARTSLHNLLGEYDSHRGALADIRADLKKKALGNLHDIVDGLLQSYDANAKKIQANLRAQIWMNVAEARYAHTGSDIGQLIELDDRMQRSRGMLGFIQQGRPAYQGLSIVDGGKQLSLEEYKNSKLLAAEKHFKARDRNFEHDIIVDNRSPVARALFERYASGGISQDILQGMLHELDSKLDTVSRTPAEGSTFLETVISYLPGIHFIASMEDWPLFGTSNAATGVEAHVLELCSKAYVGYPSFTAGNEDPTGRAALAALLFAVELAVAMSLARSSRSSSNGGGQSGQGVGGGQNTTPGIGPR